jgi:leucyl aminopeptidase
MSQPLPPSTIDAYALVPARGKALPLHTITPAQLGKWLGAQKAVTRNWLKTTGFAAKAGETALLPDAQGKLAGVVVGISPRLDPWALAHLPTSLPAGRYMLAAEFAPDLAQQLVLGWGLGTYGFDRYLSQKRKAAAQLVMPKNCHVAEVLRLLQGITLVRDLINEPANTLGPDELAGIGTALAKRYGGSAKILRGEELLKQNYPAIYAIGAGSERPPVLLDLRWGNPKARKLTLVGKGVVFDTGGYDIKPSAGMLTMKKDMGGAAHVLALALMIMEAKLPVRLRVLVPAVENSISGHALRPSDIILTRSGKTVEIGNTDAEGRVILSDCLYEAASERPEWLLDYATLTGARSVALGADIPALFSNDDKLASSLLESSGVTQDPLWRMPLHQPYWRGMKSKIADMNNAGPSAGGAITAALFLQQFVPDTQAWAHLDGNAWNGSSQPGRPEGGEAMGLRALYAAICNRFSSSAA